MPFGLKQTTGILGHYSEARSGSMRKLLGDVEAGGKQWKSVEDKWKVWKMCGRGRKGSGRPGRGRKRQEDLGK